ncbi:MAG TPA: hypothetical protein PLG07_12975, partial [Phenylobacterium sp.]|nr:hypothetical protein [Phenylobacterium sp.]
MSWIRRVLAALTPGLMFGLCGLCVVAALAALKGGDHGRLDILAHFTPFWLIGSLMACAYAVIAAPPLRVVFSVVGAAGLMASLSLMLPEYLRPIPKAAADAPAQLKVIQFNAWRNNADIEGTARWLADQKADVIIMEEAEPPLIAEVEATTGLHLTCPKCGISIYTRAKPLKPPKVTEPPGPTDWRLHLPLAVAFPHEESQVAPLLEAIASLGLKAIPRGAGTGLTGGAVPLAMDCVMVNTERLDR